MRIPFSFFPFLFVTLSATAQIEVVVHRGANHLAPENTKASAEAAIKLGAHYVEIDVRTSNDGVLYIMHDPTVNRTTDGSGLLGSMTSAEIDKLDAGSWFGKEFKGEPVPKLREYLNWIKGKAKVYFDVKDANPAQLIALVKETGMENDCFFWSGSKKWMKMFRKLSAELPLKVNAGSVEEVEAAVKTYHPQIIECGIGNVTAEFIAACKKHNLRIMLYGSKEDETYFGQVLRTDGVELINIDRPEIYFEVLRAN
ncbi:MAG: glycerophosphodiester phosphodiesterase family protein [Flavobacteriales bacterium]|nr:glycerophosphodiester phosphodiesterase family protein [Flavobacteriales bacterium]